MYISSFYNPKTANEPGYLEYKRSIDQTASIKNCFIVSGGDFNLPGWDWKAKCIKDNTQHVRIHQRFGDILDDNGLLQIVEEPTSQTNTLDLLITNHPNSFTRVEILPGVSDHDIVFAEISVIPSRKKQAARKIPLYSKANWDKMREDINNIKNEIVTMTTSKSNINDIWLVFKTSLEKSVNLNIPHKQARTKDSPPWISRDLKRLIRKRDRLYKKKKKSHDKKDSEKYKTIKRQVQQGLRRSYWKYVESIVTPPEDNIIENRGYAHTSSKAIIGTVAGGLVVLLIVCVVFISILIIKKRKGTKKTKKNAGFHENSGFQNVQIGDEYEEVISKSDTEEKQTSKTYEALRPMEAVEVYDNLENDKGLPSSKSTSKTYESLETKDAVDVYDDLDNHKDLPSSKLSVDHYEALGTKDKPNVYEELENQKGQAEKVYVNEAF
ncbi:unnamed protein product [Mytilus edulis]|uniref:Endonuclease/exonuclease/phosphatase domain-containing protein n=1 Tax=Mytilus edulis TaxID=6550 RepID=A0A8S3VCB2_MYTED|nr:unnamed protein product [Mytilus edulis]